MKSNTDFLAILWTQFCAGNNKALWLIQQEISEELTIFLLSQCSDCLTVLEIEQLIGDTFIGILNEPDHQRAEVDSVVTHINRLAYRNHK